MRSSGSHAATLPLPAIMGLCVSCFLIGHFTHRNSQPAVAPQAPRAPVLKQEVAAVDPVQRKLQMDPSTQALIANSGSGVLLENGAFTEQFLKLSGMAELRPPLKPAASGDDFVTIIPYQILSWHPRIIILPNFIDKARCDHVIKLASDKMYPSGLAYRPGEKVDPNQQTRTSTGTFLSYTEDKDGVLSWIEEKIARFTMVPVNHGEHFNVLHYKNEQHYDSHMDTFDPKDFGPQASQRLATVLLYLSDVPEGGETVFKREGKDGADRPVNDWRSCGENEFKYKPRLGDAVLFYSLNPDLTINPRALHGGCPVHKGDKWVMTKWIHEKPIRPDLSIV